MKKVVIIVLACLLGLFCILSLVVYGVFNSTRNEGIDFETRLSAQYLDNQNELSAFISGFYELVGIYNTQSEDLNNLLTDVVKGRYDSKGISSGDIINVIVENYPEMAPAELVKLSGKIMDYISARRESFKAKQELLIDQLRVYQKWRDTGFVKEMVIRILGFPSNRLQARIGENVYYGQEALDKMYRIILTQDAIDAYESGTMDPLIAP